MSAADPAEGSRTLAICASTAAALSWWTPWFQGWEKAPDYGRSDEWSTGRDDIVHTGLHLSQPSAIDGHQAVSGWVVALALLGTLLVVVMAVLASRSRRWHFGAAGLATALLIASLPIAHALGRYDPHYPSQATWGFDVWRLALLAVVVGSLSAWQLDAAPPTGLEDGQRKTAAAARARGFRAPL